MGEPDGSPTRASHSWIAASETLPSPNERWNQIRLIPFSAHWRTRSAETSCERFVEALSSDCRLRYTLFISNRRGESGRVSDRLFDGAGECLFPRVRAPSFETCEIVD